MEDHLDIAALSPEELNVLSKFKEDNEVKKTTSLHNPTRSNLYSSTADQKENGQSNFKKIMNCNGRREIVVQRKKQEARQRKPIEVKKKELKKVPCDTFLVERLVKNIVKRSDSKDSKKKLKVDVPVPIPGFISPQ